MTSKPAFNPTMRALLRQTWSIHYPGSNRHTFQRGPLGLVLLSSAKSARCFYSTDRSGNPYHFYNRQHEVNQLFTRLKGEPTFTVLLGPPSSGKTALVREVTSLRRPDNSPEFHPLTIDLRQADTSKNGSFLNAFLSKAQNDIEGGWWKNWISKLKVSAGELSVSAKSSPTPVARVSANCIFEQLQDRIKPWNFFHGERPALIVVDEANFFKRMEDDTIQAFFDFAVRISKQEQKMHIILTSSDSFFESWLKKRINSTHFVTKVVGDLPEQEAHKYFLHVVERNPQLSEEMKDYLRLLDFSIPFRMTGGRMFFIRKYVSQVCESGPLDDPMKFEPVINAYAQLADDFLGGAKTYKQQQAVKVSQLLIHSRGYIEHGDLVSKYGREVVEEMIERNFLHYRPSADFSRDLVDPPAEPIVTAQSEPALRAMEALCKKYGPVHSGISCP